MNVWWDFANEVFSASLQTQRVVSFRLLKIARGGPAAAQETRRMIWEKLDASSEAAFTLASGGSLLQVMNRYRSLMRANEKRLRRRRR